MAGSIGKFITRIRDFLRNDDQAVHKIALTLTSLIVFYLLNKLEAILTTFFDHLFMHHATFLLVLFSIGLCGLLILFQNEIIQLAEKAKKYDQNLLNAVGASICFLFICVVVVPLMATSQIAQLNDKNLNMEQFKLDLTEKTYVKNEIVTQEHLNNLRRNFNIILKNLNKKRPNNTESDRLTIDGDIMAVHLYLEKTLPLFLVSEAEELQASSSQASSSIKLLIGLGLVGLGIYLTTKALFWQILSEMNAQIERDMKKTEETIESEKIEEPKPITPPPEVVKPEPIISRDLKDLLIAVEAPKEEPVETEEVVPGEIQVVVEYCLNCEEMRNKLLEYDQKMEEIENELLEASQSVSVPYQTHNPFKKSLQNLDRAEVIQMSYPSETIDAENAYEFDSSNAETLRQPYETLVNEDGKFLDICQI